MCAKAEFPRVASATDLMMEPNTSYCEDDDVDSATTVKSSTVKSSLSPPPVCICPSHVRAHDYCNTYNSTKIKASPRKSVSFSENVSVRQYYSSLSLADQQSHLLWYSQDELMTIAKKNQALVEQVLSNNGNRNTHNGRVLCLRGLEKHLNPCAHFVQRDMARKVVLAEQCLQQSTGGRVDEEQLAFLYRIVTRRSLLAAAERGCQDSKEVQTYVRTLRRRTSIIYRRDSLRGLY